MPQEIERKFLLGDLPKELIGDSLPMAIKQGYLVLGQQCELRVRMLDGRYYFTSKRGQGMVREEQEQEIDQVIFDLVWPFTETKRIEKSRYSIQRNNMVYDVDVYSGDLQGLMVMEVEFSSVEEAQQFSIPPYCAAEVTDDPRYKNAALALKGRP